MPSRLKSTAIIGIEPTINKFDQLCKLYDYAFDLTLSLSKH